MVLANARFNCAHILRPSACNIAAHHLGPHSNSGSIAENSASGDSCHRQKSGEECAHSGATLDLGSSLTMKTASTGCEVVLAVRPTATPSFKIIKMVRASPCRQSHQQTVVGQGVVTTFRTPSIGHILLNPRALPAARVLFLGDFNGQALPCAREKQGGPNMSCAPRAPFGYTGSSGRAVVILISSMESSAVTLCTRTSEISA